MPTLTIDGSEVTVEPGTTVLQACESLGIEIPRFCYHERLAIAGNCRMCLVEMEKAPKLIASCAQPAGDGMVIRTNTPAVKKAREGVMELLLINHPLDCPICDQGGECDLQDQAMAYGTGQARYREAKRAVGNKNLGPLIKGTMTRCIHCTRCVRFLDGVAGIEELGGLYRGERTEIGTFVEQAISSELSGNLIDLCPVGALTSKPYAFHARPWELKPTETIDVHDAVGSNIRVDARGREILRVLPRLNEEVNEEWISDKTRFANDGLARKRLDQPYVRRDGQLQPASWQDAFAAIAKRLEGVDGKRIAALAGDLACAESMTALKDLMTALGSPHLDCRQDGAKLGGGARAGWLFNSTIAGIEDADACLLIGSNPRLEAPVLNARLRKRWLAGGFKVFNLGPAVDLTYRTTELGSDARLLERIGAGEHEVAEVLSAAERPMLIVGQQALGRPDGGAILAAARAIAEHCGLVGEDWNGFNVLHTAAARVAGLDLGILPRPEGRDTAGILAGAAEGAIDFIYLLGADEIDTKVLGEAFVVYQGHHGDSGAQRADVVLPGAAYTEKGGTWVNTEGRVQRGQRAVFPPGEAREDWTILRALSEVLGHTLPYDGLPELRRRMVELAPHLGQLDEIGPAPWGDFGQAGPIADTPLGTAGSDFHLSDPICRASATMAACSAQRANDHKGTGTDG
ncbi:MAG: NADH-quinone oxidoreductase subunit NuoG [Alphaproteobacteria bacterium]|jgi:NADH-quinone oxidoreductase subunit G|nr:NADH-quinone oxidoreductase subunit G [Rhodospirillaceae bacterium]MDP6406391.1 NADH-quinone oxidoreductase subunit NuoG [Alphaproteobacteria bacterium]MDP6620821.1 NADH-quinone oxidoreductase subunit NuoG [Alphaproteobacteria bacterium]